MLRQANDGFVPNSACRKSAFRKYWALSTLWTNELLFICKCQPCLAKRARLKALRSPKPNPPSSFSAHILSQLSHAILFLPSFWPHQNLWIIPANSSHRESGSLKTLIVYVGMACATALMRTSLLAWDNSFSFQPESLLSSFSFKALKVCFLICPLRMVGPNKSHAVWSPLLQSEILSLLVCPVGYFC